MPPTEHELRLRERLGRLRNLPLLGGARLSGELERLQRQIARIGEEATDEEVWRKGEPARHDERPATMGGRTRSTTSSACSPTGSSYTATGRSATTAR